MPAVDFDEKKIDAIFKEFDQCHLPGAAIGIAVRGTPVYRKAFGLANMDLPLVLSPSTRMRIASVSKHFACLAYMLLCEDGIAAIDDPVGKYLPELHEVNRQVTMRQLMGNVGGLRDAHDLCWQFSGTGRHVSSGELLAFYRDIDEVNAPPGTAWIYNNGGFLMLTTAIERLTGDALEDVLRKRIFEPIGMHSTLLRRFDTDFVSGSASLHMNHPGGGYEKSYLGVAFAGEGGIVSTIDDMLRWLEHMDSPVAGSAETWATMHEPQRLANGTSTGYGLGLITNEYRGLKALYHLGGAMGGSAHMVKLPDVGLDVVIMVNRGDVWATLLAEEVIDACISGFSAPKSVPPCEFSSGVFLSKTTGRVIQLFAKSGEQIASIDGSDMPVQPDAELVLWPGGISRHVKQGLTLVGERAKPAALRLTDFGNVDEFMRQDAPRRMNVGAIAGNYCSDTLGIQATIFGSNETAQLMSVGPFGSIVYPLECLADGIWRARSKSVSFLGGVLVFDSDGGAFRFSSASTRGLSFRRAASA